MPAKGQNLPESSVDSAPQPRSQWRVAAAAGDGQQRAVFIALALALICLSGITASEPSLGNEHRSDPMNKPLSEADLATPKVTTGPIAGSRKIYSTPDAAPDLRVPLREVPLSEGAGEEPVRIYDPSGVYTDNDAAIDVEKGSSAPASNG